MKEKAKNFIQLGIQATNFKRRSSLNFLPFNIILCLIAILLFKDVYFIISIFIIVLIDIITSILFYIKWSVVIGFVSQAVQLLMFCIILDMLCYAMYNFYGLFKLSEFLLFMCFQVVILILSIPFNFYYYKHFNEKRKVKKNYIVGCITGLSCELAMIFCKVFLTDVSLGVIVTVISLLINIIIYLLSYIIVMDLFRVFLIIKYQLNRELKEQ